MINQLKYMCLILLLIIRNDLTFAESINKQKTDIADHNADLPTRFGDEDDVIKITPNNDKNTSHKTDIKDGGKDDGDGGTKSIDKGGGSSKQITTSHSSVESNKKNAKDNKFDASHLELPLLPIDGKVPSRDDVDDDDEIYDDDDDDLGGSHYPDKSGTIDSDYKSGDYDEEDDNLGPTLDNFGENFGELPQPEITGSEDSLPVFLLDPQNSYVVRSRPAILKCKASNALQVSFNDNFSNFLNFIIF